MPPAIMNGHFRLLKYTLPINTSNCLCTTQAVKVYPAHKHYLPADPECTMEEEEEAVIMVGNTTLVSGMGIDPKEKL